jgi:hypothetical protein
MKNESWLGWMLGVAVALSSVGGGTPVLAQERGATSRMPAQRTQMAARQAPPQRAQMAAREAPQRANMGSRPQSRGAALDRRELDKPARVERREGAATRGPSERLQQPRGPNHRARR